MTSNDKGKISKIKNTKDIIRQIDSDFEYEDDNLYDQVFDFELNNKKIKNEINLDFNVLKKKGFQEKIIYMMILRIKIIKILLIKMNLNYP